MASMVRSGAITSPELVEAALERAGAVDRGFNAFTVPGRPSALTQAAEVDNAVRAGRHLPLAGVPITMKANQPAHLPLARKLGDLGAVVIGRTAMPPPGHHQTWGTGAGGAARNP